jgi:hypothetical protein
MKVWVMTLILCENSHLLQKGGSALEILNVRVRSDTPT